MRTGAHETTGTGGWALVRSLGTVAALAAFGSMAVAFGGARSTPPTAARVDAGTLTKASSAAGAAQSAPVAFVGVNVVPMTGERLDRNRTVIVMGDRIRDIGAAERMDIPEGAVVIEGGGRYLMPGLAEMHAHIPPEQAGQEWIGQVLFLYLANGITTIRGMLGQPAHLELQDRVARGDVLGPRIYTSGPSLNGNSLPDPDSASRAVRHQAAAGYDFLKLHPGLGRDVFDAIDRAADSVGITYAGHVSNDVGLARALEAGYASIDHLDGYVPALVPDGAPVDRRDAQFFGFNLIAHVDVSRIQELARRTRERGVWNVPTQSLFIDFLSGEDPDQMARRPEIRYMPPEMVENWVRSVRSMRDNPGHSEEAARRFLQVRREILAALHRAGAPLLLGSDAPQVFNVPGFSIHQELAALREAGLSPYQALLTGTRNVARFFGAEAEYGTIETGKIADLVLLDANPLEDLGNVRRVAGVMVRGRWLPASEIQQRLDAIAAAHAAE